jgi:16S rRNA processing protein RimM
LNEITDNIFKKHDDLCLIGKILKPQGIKGELLIKIFPDPRLNEYIFNIKKIYTSNSCSFNIKKIRRQKNNFVLSLEEIENRNQCEELRDQDIYIDKKQIMQSGENTYYWFEAPGYLAYDTGNNFLGTVEQIVNNGIYDIFIIDHNKKEVMIPGIFPFLTSIDKEKKIIIFHVIPGLIDINDAV